ncbi:MAG: hypothetical protein JST82_07540 [Bacteroidetes bacterium]|nr:hypothetical protein [Bacteroidota bacterium]
MKKLICLAISIIMISGCNNDNQNTSLLNTRIDSLQHALANSYKPGLGEFMSGIQTHHAKLWFAASNKNWPLANFELDEITEAIDDIKMFEKDRVEIKSIDMILPVLDSIRYAIKNKNGSEFQNSFILLTQTCNNCHKAVNFSFNVVTIPKAEPVTNQDFKPQ